MSQFLAVTNNASSTLAGAILSTDTSLTIQGGDVALFPGSGNYELTLFPAGANPIASNSEIVLVTAGQGTATLTISRHQEGTSALGFSAGDNVALLLTAKIILDIDNTISGGTSGQIFTSQGAGVAGAWANSSSNTNGWIPDPNTLVYVSASSFKVTGTNVTAQYTKGTRIMFTNNSITFYGVVGSSSFSTDTTVNLIANNDYAINNSAITAPYYSYQSCPQGYPGWLNYTLSYTGFSSNPTDTVRFSVIGNMCTMEFNNTGSGTSNNVAKTISIPVASAQSIECAAMGMMLDNGTIGTAPGQVKLAGSSATATIFKTLSQGLFTNSGTCALYISTFSYEF